MNETIRDTGAAFVCVLVLLASPSGAQAQEATAQVTGRVTDAETGAGVPGAVVHVEDPRRHEVTHEDGRYHLLRLPPGRYTLSFEHLGYRGAVREVTLAAGEAAIVDVALRPAAVELEELVVTATLGGRAARDAMRPSASISGRELDRELGSTVAATLEDQAGVAVASMGPAPARPVIRGLGGDRVLVLEDGERVGDISAASADHAVAVDPMAAERIEVVRGPAALFYGSNALGGVVNVITEEIPSSLPGHARGRATLQGRSVSRAAAAEGTIADSFGPISLRASANLRDSGLLRTPRGTVPNTGSRTFGGSVGGAWVDAWGHAGASVRLHDAEYGIPPAHPAHTEPGEEHIEGEHEEPAHDVRIETERWAAHGQVHWTRRTGPFEHLELDLKATTLEHSELEDDGHIGARFGLDTYSAELVGRHDGISFFTRGALGVRAQANDYEADRGHAVALGVDERDLAVFALEEVEHGPIQVQVGARLDHALRTPVSGPGQVEGVAVRERTFANIAASGALLYQLLDDVRMGVSVARAFRTPASDELYSEGPHLATYTFEVGNPRLEAEVGIGIDAFLRLEGERLRGEVAAFRNTIDGFIQPRNTGQLREGLFVYRFANTEARFVGGEASLEWSPVRRFAIDGTLSYVRADDVALDSPLPLIPPLTTTLSLRHERTRWYAQVGWRAAAAQERVPEAPALPATHVGYCERTGDAHGCVPLPGEFVRTGGYSLFDATLGYRFFAGGTLHSVTLSASNLLNATYRNHLSRIKRLLPEPGRGVSLVYRVTF